jgi:hypothetical protein
VQWFSTLFDFLRRSKHVHLRRTQIDSPKEAIDLIDRFVDDKLAYPLEWDDFISWKNSNESVERLRDQLADLEAALMAVDRNQRDQGVAKMIQLRNHYAKLLGLTSRGE